MDVHQFWEIIEAGKNSDQPEVILKAQLSKVSPEQVHMFATHFNNMFDRAYRWDMWCAAYLLGGGCSDDGFIYFIRGLIAQGRDAYESAVYDPNSLIAFLDAPCFTNESFGLVARDVYGTLTGAELSYIDHPSVKTAPEWNPKYPMTEDVWDFDDEQQNRLHLPAFCKVFYARQ